MKKIITFLIILLLATDVAPAQKKAAHAEKEKDWFVARVIDTEPFVLEYLDDSRRLPIEKDEFEIEVNPQRADEKIGNFRIGDILSGEFCYFIFTRDCGPNNYAGGALTGPNSGMPLPRPTVFNLKNLGEQAKIRYRNRGLLFRYAPRRTHFIDALKIFRDGSVVVEGSGGYIKRRLPARALAAIVRQYPVDQADRAAVFPGKIFGDNAALQALAAGYQYVFADSAAAELKFFFERLDVLVDDYFEKATFSVDYDLRYAIKEWEFGDVFPLDEALAGGNLFLDKNRRLFSKIKPPSRFVAEVRGNVTGKRLTVYRYKGELYHFQFSNCNNIKTDGWACAYLWKIHRDTVRWGYEWIYSDWSAKSRAKLKNIPTRGRSATGLDISPAEFKKHRDFFLPLVGGTDVLFREGDYLYTGIRIRFR